MEEQPEVDVSAIHSNVCESEANKNSDEWSTEQENEPDVNQFGYPEHDVNQVESKKKKRR